MGAHFASPPARRRHPERRHQAAALCVALGVGLLGFTFVDGDGRTGRDQPRTSPRSSQPTVLGVTILPDADDPADPAVPATFDDPATSSTTRRPTTTTRPATTSTVRPTTTTGPAELIPPVVVSNPDPVSTTTETTDGTSTTTSTSDTP